MTSNTWEVVTLATNTANTHRLRVHGGWIVRVMAVNSMGDIKTESTCYVPDEHHEWRVKEIEELAG